MKSELQGDGLSRGNPRDSEWDIRQSIENGLDRMEKALANLH
jgi:hypothetical protein